jgi:hypothetical protein
MPIPKYNATKTADKAHYYTRHQKEMNRHLLGPKVGRNSVVGTETSYGLDGPVVESRWGRHYPRPSITALGLTQPPIQGVTGLFLRGKGVEAWRSPPTPSSAEVNERVELYLYTPSGPPRQDIG